MARKVTLLSSAGEDQIQSAASVIKWDMKLSFARIKISSKEMKHKWQIKKKKTSFSLQLVSRVMRQVKIGSFIVAALIT